MTNREIVRLKTSDKPVYIRDVDYQGDGTQTSFKLQHQDVQSPGVTVYVNGAVQLGTSYSVDLDAGIVTFVTAPTDGAALEFEYYTAVFSDEEVDQFLLEAGNNVNYASALLLHAWAANAAKLAKKQTLAGGGGTGTDVEDTAVTAEQLRKSAQAYFDLYLKTSDETVSSPAHGLTEIGWTEFQVDELIYQDLIRNN